jgi:P27 family predicted phage terminase small subunit
MITDMKGRKPKAIEVTEASGGFRKNPSRRPTNVIKGDSRDPSPPDFILLDEKAHEVWNETVDVLRSAQILSKTDTALLAVFCSTYSEWIKCHVHISQNGHSDDSGKTSPESVAFFKLAGQHIKLLAELGLSPSSRARLSVATSDTDQGEEVTISSLLKSMKG